MSIAAENIHETNRVDDCRVSVSRRRPVALHEASLLGLVHRVGHGLRALDLGDQLAVDFEGLVCVLDNESVCHAHADRRAQLCGGAVCLVHVFLC